MAHLELIVIGVIAFIFGICGAALLVKYTNIIDKISKHERYKQKILNDPELLLEKLKENGDIVDMGEKMDLYIVEKDGKKQIEVKMTSAPEEAIEESKKPIKEKKQIKKKRGKKK